MKPRSFRHHRLAAIGAAGCALANALHAASLLTGTGLANNQDVPATYGSYLTGTPNIGIDWSPVGNGGWQTYSEAGWTHPSALNETGTGVYQMDEADPGKAYQIVFSPDEGFNVLLSSVDFNVYTGGGDFHIDWTVTGSSSGALASGVHDAPTDGASTLSFGNLTGSVAEELTLVLKIGSGSGTNSYLAIDNLAFDQVADTEPGLTHFASDSAYAGRPLTLSWTIANPNPAVKVTLSDGVSVTDVTANTNLTTGDGSLQVSPLESTTYTLSLDGANSMQLTVLIGEALGLTSSTQLATAPDYQTLLSWEVRPVDAGLVTISDGSQLIDVTADTDPLTGLGSRLFSVPGPATTFTLDANESGHTAQVQVLREQANSGAFSISSSSITTEETLTVSWTGAAAGPTDWVGIYRRTDLPGLVPSAQWNYLNGTQTAGAAAADGSLTFSGLPAGDYYAALLVDDGYEIAQGPILFTVTEPQDPAIRVVSTSMTGSDFTLTWESKEGFDYDIYASAGLEGDPQVDPSWQRLEFAWPSAGATTSYTEHLGSSPPARRFYRVYEFPSF
ncbi:hypothetical protein [Haloferula sargassicola]|uniref:Uncharacterized protein n=1 Tax=Haloferula sargassicola TaxID=490096 RepID=A0ABP9UKK0_9BACT